MFAELHANYLAPAYYDEELRTAVRPGRSRALVATGSSSGRAADERLIAEGHAVLVGYDYERNESVPLPDDLRARLERAMQAEPPPGGGAWA